MTCWKKELKSKIWPHYDFLHEPFILIKDLKEVLREAEKESHIKWLKAKSLGDSQKQFAIFTAFSELRKALKQEKEKVEK